jgi:hypothetical protein
MRDRALLFDCRFRRDVHNARRREFMNAQEIRRAKLDPSKQIFIVASDPRTANQYDAMLMRIRKCMEALETYFDVIASVPDEIEDDENALLRFIAPAHSQMTLRIMPQYPNPAQFDADLATLRGMRTEIKRLPINGE